MRTFTIVLACVTAVLLLLVGYQFFMRELSVEVLDYRFEDAVDNPESFEVAQGWINSKNYDSLMLFKDEQLGDISNYMYVYINVRVTNKSLLPAEWLLVHALPVETDILQFRQQPVTLQPLSNTQVQVVLLADKRTGKVRREAGVEYYMFGEYLTARSSTPDVVATAVPEMQYDAAPEETDSGVTAGADAGGVGVDSGSGYEIVVATATPE